MPDPIPDERAHAEAVKAVCATLAPSDFMQGFVTERWLNSLIDHVVHKAITTYLAALPELEDERCVYCGASRSTVPSYCGKNPSGKRGAPHLWAAQRPFTSEAGDEGRVWSSEARDADNQEAGEALVARIFEAGSVEKLAHSVGESPAWLAFGEVPLDEWLRSDEVHKLIRDRIVGAGAWDDATNIQRALLKAVAEHREESGGE